jgi:hypothetical protein
MMTTISLELARQRREEQIRDAAQRRLVARSSSTSLRRTVGRTIIRRGERMAAEPSLSLARPR